jgi:ABC-type multidrug transport system fused ATPase/permease subunit
MTVLDGDLDEFMEAICGGDGGRSEPSSVLRVPGGAAARETARGNTARTNLPGETAMIRLENVTKSYSTEVTALRDASFDVAKAEFVFLVGPSGSGKSTLLRLMNRQERPEKGAVWVAGRNINEMPDSKIEAAPHQQHLFRITSCSRIAPCTRTSRSPSR